MQHYDNTGHELTVPSHTEAASGILGVIKAVMMIQRGCVLPNANFEKLNDKIEGKEKLKVRTHHIFFALRH